MLTFLRTELQRFLFYFCYTCYTVHGLVVGMCEAKTWQTKNQARGRTFFLSMCFFRQHVFPLTFNADFDYLPGKQFIDE